MVYAIQLGMLLVAFLWLALAVYVRIRLSIDFAFKHDLIRKHEAKATLSSGANQHLSLCVPCENPCRRQLRAAHVPLPLLARACDGVEALDRA
jgi:hypothetical protein